MPFPQQIKTIIDSIFSNGGYNIQKFNIKFPSSLNINIVKNEDNIDLIFTKDLPKITWKKFITLSARVSGINLNEKGGLLKLKYFPDIPFSYEDSEERFGIEHDFSSIQRDIEEEYIEDEQRFLAKKCLQYASEWATIASQGTSFQNADLQQEKQLRRDCKHFVMENIKNDPEIQAGSVLLSFLFFYIILPTILRFVLERIFKKLFN
jgi:hypothetical protein